MNASAHAVSRDAAPGTYLPEVLIVLGIAALGGAVSHMIGSHGLAGQAAAALGILATLAAVLFFHRRRGDGWQELGLARPRSWLKTILLALLGFVVLTVLLSVVQVYVVAPLARGQGADISHLDMIRGNVPLLLLSLLSVWVTAAFAEEVIYRGFLVGRLSKLLGGGGRARWAGLFVSSILFGLLHFYQGAVGIALTGIAGFLLGAVYLVLRRNLWIAILIHGLIDTMSLVAVFGGAAAA